MYHESDENRTYSGDPTGESPFATPEDLPVAEEPAFTPVPSAVPVTEQQPEPTIAPAMERVPETPAPPAPPETPTPEKKKKHGLGVGAIIIIALCCSLIGGAMGVTGTLLLRRDNTDSDAAVESQSNSTDAADGQTDPIGHSTIVEGDRIQTIIDVNKIDTSKIMTPAEVYAANVNSVVGITTSVTTNYWGYQTTSAASGSGFVLTDDGYVLTNQHVIENSNSIKVTFYDGTTADAKLIGYDINNDIAVLKVEATGLTPVKLGDSENMNVGDEVIAIGNPLGELTFSLTRGVVSALNRSVTTSTGVNMNLIQTDCAINSGNSGGPLFNLYGELVGITNAKYSGNSASGASIDNIGFAIPINNVLDIVRGIMEKGYFSKPYIGVSVTDVSEESQGYGLPKGAAVKEIVADSPAAAAGLQINDIITQVDGAAITGSSDLVAIVGDKNVGDVMKLTVYRMGQTLELTLTVGEQIQDVTAPSQPSGNQTTPGSSGTFPFEDFKDFFGQFGY